MQLHSAPRASPLVLAAFTALISSTLLTSAAPAPAPAPAPQADVSYTCDGDNAWHDASQKYTCPAGTVCKSGVVGNPCVWPDGGSASNSSGATAVAAAVTPTAASMTSDSATDAVSASDDTAVSHSAGTAGTAAMSAGDSAASDSPSVSSGLSTASTGSSSSSEDADGSSAGGATTSVASAGDTTASEPSAVDDLASTPSTSDSASADAGAAGASVSASTSDSVSAGADAGEAASTTDSASAGSATPTGAISGNATTTGSVPDTFNSTTTATTTSSNSTITGGVTGGNRFVAYWDNYDNLSPSGSAGTLSGDGSDGPPIPDLTGVTHVVLSFVDMTSWNTGTAAPALTGIGTATGGYQFEYSTDGNFSPSTVKQIKAKGGGIKVMAALGGWGFDGPIGVAVKAGDSGIDAFTDKVKGFYDAFGLDGIDIDWEFPTADEVDGLVKLVKSIKTKLPNCNLSIALGARVDTSDVAAYTSGSLSQLNSLVDMYNVMTYDYVNRYSDKTDYQAGGKVVNTVMSYYKAQGIDMSKCNIGFPTNAKYFQQVSSCSTSNPLGCALGGKAVYETNGDNGLSGWLRFNKAIDSTLGETVGAKMNEVRPQFDARPQTGTAPNPSDYSQAWYDEAHQTFWTWLEPSDIAAVCKEWKGQVGGMMVWALNQDTNGLQGGDHIKAITDCLA
nr:uncharacterized protein CI109_000749 [Kwoniella shandongensis]KAA5530571.1 hypothetical protein CI109_000749 [Kwoniella shandongensis]